MVKLFEPVDCNGEPIVVGDRVIFEAAPDELLGGLPDEDRTAIRDQVGKTHTVEGFDEYGHAEIEFIDAEGALHTIWVEPRYLRK